MSIALTLAGLCGIGLPFVPFTVGYVPISEVDWDWSESPHFTLVLPCMVLPPLISLGYVVWHVAGRLPLWVAAGGYVLAAVFAGACLTGLLGSSGASDRLVLTVIGLFLVAFASAAWISLKGVNRESPIRSLVAMQGVYATLMVFALAAAHFWGDYQTGAWLGAITLFAYLGQITLAVKKYRSVLLILIPLALIGWIVSAG